MIQNGSIAVLKTTGEKVFILNLWYSELNGPSAKIRRPVISDKDGITHETVDVTVAELFTVEDYAQSQIDEMLLRAKYQKKLDSALDATEPEVLPSAPKSDPSVN